MKSLFKAIIFFKLKWIAKIHLRRMGAKVIGITGSLGKTTTKDALAHILSRNFRVLYSKSGYNTEFGIPLMILGLSSPHSSIMGWMRVLFQALKKLSKKEQYDFVIAEMGVDKPNDMNTLLSIVKPHIAILTHVAKVHVADGQFADESAILQEKQKIFSKQKYYDVAIINIDHEMIRGIKGNLKSQVITYGTRQEAAFKIKSLQQRHDSILFVAEYKNHFAQFDVPILGKHFAYALAPAIITAALQGMSMNEIAASLADFKLPKGRMNVIRGKKETTIIDSSYNANPLSVEAGLKLLNEIPCTRRVVALGQMNELGSYSIAEHKKIGQIVPGACDFLITVHGHAKYISDEALKNGMNKKNVHHFQNSAEAGKFLAKHVMKGDVILVKGSQNKVRMEDLIYEIMENKKDASKLLVRQEKEWKKKK